MTASMSPSIGSPGGGASLAHSTTLRSSVGGRIALLTITPEEGVTWLRRCVKTAPV